MATQLTTARRRLGRGLSVAAAAILFLSAGASVARAQAADDTATTIEVIGLRRWTVQMLRDTLAARAPGTALVQCAEVLVRSGFPSADVTDFVRDGHHHVVITLVEPGDSARVKLRPEPPDSSPDLREWRGADSIMRAHFPAFATAVALLGVHRAGDARAERDALRPTRGDSVYIRRFWAFLDAHRGRGDLRRALRVLATDGNAANGAVAATILGNFPWSDRAWRALMDAQRSPHGAVASTAMQVLLSMARREPHAVDWRPATVSIRALLSGTNVFVLRGSLDVLRATHVAPALAGPLLGGGNAGLVLAHLGAEEPSFRESAHAFLVQVSGRDLGYDAASWARWISTLP